MTSFKSNIRLFDGLYGFVVKNNNNFLRGFTVPQSLLFFRFVKDNREDNDKELIKK